MASFSNKSANNLQTCNDSLIITMKEAIKYFDFSVLYGHRSPREQNNLFKKGRAFNGSKWVIVDKKKVVTYKDGYKKKSDHNYTPSRAVDVVPYPVDWKDIKRFYFMAGMILALNKKLYEENKVKHLIKWGGDWDNDMDFNDQTFMDLAHFEIIGE